MKLNLLFFKKLPEKEKRITISTKLTLLRIFLVPFIVALIVLKYWLIAFLLIIIAAISDLLDGILARKFNEQTVLGACLDPLADKFFILSCYLVLALGYSPNFSIPLWFFWLIFIKETIMVSGALAIFMIKGWLDVKPTFLGKLSMDIQSIFIIWLFSCYFFNWQPIKTYNFMLYIIITIVLSSLFQYVTIGFRQFILSAYAQK